MQLTFLMARTLRRLIQTGAELFIGCKNPLFTGVSLVCLSWQCECEREVGLFSLALAEEDKRGLSIFKLNDKC